MKSQSLSLSIANAVAVVRFSNPPQEYMDDVTVQDLTAALDDIENNSDVRAVVLTGASEGTFVRHYDVRELEQLGRMLAGRHGSEPVGGRPTLLELTKDKDREIREAADHLRKHLSHSPPAVARGSVPCGGPVR